MSRGSAADPRPPPGHGERESRAASRAYAAGRFATAGEMRQWLETSRRRRCWRDWRWQMRHAIAGADLDRAGLLSGEAARRAADRYPALVTPYFATLTEWNDPADPLRRQWLPDGRELARRRDAGEDPFGERKLSPLPGVVHRFPDRLLVVATAACAMRCRHCTRKNTLTPCRVLNGERGLRDLLRYLRARPAVREVIVSGGDPLLLPDERLLPMIERLAALKQLDAIRIGTRLPSALPMRVTSSLARALGKHRKIWVNTQFNHARELTAEAAAACARLVEAGIPVSSQSVLLAGINDSAEAMAARCRGLQRLRVRPYYVFLCDPVAGTLHFRAPVARARRIARELSRRLGGQALPRFVADRPGADAKQPLF